MNKEKLYKATCKNHRMIESSINVIKKNIKSNINLENEEEIIIYTRIFSFLVTCRIETRILKIIYEINAFDESEIHIILKNSTLCEKWIRTLNMLICKM
ncbi:MAG TPA: hypothetical protein DG753_10190, partial [Clostridium sp.]|nr:hypothetical protein [Clostridium sp.]